MSSIVPLYDRVLAKKVAKEEVSEGGILLPHGSDSNDAQVRAVVLAVGEGYPLDDNTTRPLKVAVGDTVVIEEYCGTNLRDGKDEFILVREENILAIIVPT